MYVNCRWQIMGYVICVFVYYNGWLPLGNSIIIFHSQATVPRCSFLTLCHHPPYAVKLAFGTLFCRSFFAFLSLFSFFPFFGLVEFFFLSFLDFSVLPTSEMNNIILGFPF